MILNRRQFLLRSLVATAGASVLPSALWPYRKIFVPASPVLYRPDNFAYGMDLAMEWDADSGLWSISGRAVEKMYHDIVRKFAEPNLLRRKA